jgi:hypothetical protein
MSNLVINGTNFLPEISYDCLRCGCHCKLWGIIAPLHMGHFRATSESWPAYHCYTCQKWVDGKRRQRQRQGFMVHERVAQRADNFLTCRAGWRRPGPFNL